MLLRTYAVEPEAVCNWDRYRLLVSPCGASNGRLIAKYPAQWAKLVLRACMTCGDIERKKIQTALEAAGRKMIDCAAPYEAQCDWICNAWRERSAFSAIIARALQGPLPNCFVADEISEDHKGWKTETGTSVQRTLAALVDVVRPLLRISKCVKFVDPYYSSGMARWRVFREYFRAAIQGSPLCEFQVHLGNKESQHSLQSFKNCLEKNVMATWGIPDEVEVLFVRWQETQKEVLHPRYLLTEHCGIGSEHGWDTGDGSTDVSLLADTIYTRRIEDYTAATTPFDFVDAIRIFRGRIQEARLVDGHFV